MVIYIDAEKAFEKIEDLFIKKNTPTRWVQTRAYLNILKTVYDKPTDSCHT